MQRPISPHLQIYKPQLTSMLSILHRLTGIYLVSAAIALAIWIIALGSRPDCFAALMSFFATIWGKLLFSSWIFSFFYHLANGLRHLVWDVGKGFDMSLVNKSGLFVLGFAFVASLIFLAALI